MDETENKHISELKWFKPYKEEDYQGHINLSDFPKLLWFDQLMYYYEQCPEKNFNGFS